MRFASPASCVAKRWVWPTSAWRRSRSLVETSGDHVTSLVIAAAALAVSIVR
jgi:hypothetical protein